MLLPLNTLSVGEKYLKSAAFAFAHKTQIHQKDYARIMGRSGDTMKDRKIECLQGQQR